MLRHMANTSPLLRLAPVCALAACGQGEVVDSSSTTEALVATCVERVEAAPQGAWMCPDARAVECSSPRGARVDEIYVELPAPGSGQTCSDLVLEVERGPFQLGLHDIVVRDVANGSSLDLCRAQLEVVDTTPPRVRPRDASRWPANHKLREISPRDCVDVIDACDPAVSVRFTWVESDEPVDVNGSGHTEPDIVVHDCERIEIRAERAGGRNGRVYTLGYRAVDGSGNQTTGTCEVKVPHDQGGGDAVRDATDHRVELSECSAS